MIIIRSCYGMSGCAGMKKNNYREKRKIKIMRDALVQHKNPKKDIGAFIDPDINHLSCI